MSRVETKIVTGPEVVAHHRAAVRLIVRYYGDGESWSRYLVIDRAKLCKQLAAARARGVSQWARNNMICPEWSVFYHGPGQRFAHSPGRMRLQSKRWVVWMQSGGIDC